MGTDPLLTSKPYSYQAQLPESLELKGIRIWIRTSTPHLSTVFSCLRCSHGSLTIFMRAL